MGIFMTSIILNQISSYFANPLKKQEQRQNTNSSALKTLEKDTVSFSANATIEKFSRKIHKKGLNKIYTFQELCSKLFDNFQYKIRIKHPESVASKIENKSTAKKISFLESFKHITDQAGARVITDGSQTATDKIINNLIKEIQAGKLAITSIRNYHGNGIQPYLSTENINLLKESQKKSPIKVLQGVEAEKLNGYTAGHITGITNKGLNVEFQIKGQGINAVDESTHITHDLSLGKTSAISADSLAPIVNAYRILSPEKIENYNNYLKNCYRIARETEINGQKSKFPAIPDGIPNILSIKNISKLTGCLKHD